MSKNNAPHLGDYEHSAMRSLYLMQERYKKDVKARRAAELAEAKRNRERIAALRSKEQEGQTHPSDHDDLKALYLVDLRKRQQAQEVGHGRCPRCGGRIVGDSCLNCGYVPP